MFRSIGVGALAMLPSANRHKCEVVSKMEHTVSIV